MEKIFIGIFIVMLLVIFLIIMPATIVSSMCNIDESFEEWDRNDAHDEDERD